MDVLGIVQLFTSRPELALVALILLLVGIGIQKLFSSMLSVLSGHLSNIDQNFKSVAQDIGGLRVDVAKVAERLEAREEVVEAKFNDLDRRVTKLEDKGE